MRREIIITPLMEFGGSTSYLKLFIQYVGIKNLIIVPCNNDEINNLYKIAPNNQITVKLLMYLRPYATFKKRNVHQNITELLLLLWSLNVVFFLSLRFGFAGISISAIDPEKYLYLLWLPFIKVRYILHSEPGKTEIFFTTFTCNKKLGKRKSIITVSNANRSMIIKNWKISKNNAKYVYVIYNCAVEAYGLKEHNFIDNKVKLIITMGHVIEYKNPYLWLDVALRVVALRSNTKFYWLGNGNLLDYFQLQTKTNDKINFIGAVANTYEYLNKATIYYQPSLLETHGIAVLEAMLNYLPCIVTNVGGLPESVDDRKSGFVVSMDNIDEHVARIIELLDKPYLCKSFGECAYMRYKKLFSYHKFKSEMDKIYLA